MEKIPIDQILKSFDGQLSEKEQAKLDRWLSLSEENRQQYYELRKTYSATGKQRIDFEPDTVKALEKVNRKISSKRTTRLVWQAAAAIILMVLATQIVLRTQSTHNWKEITAQQQQIVFLPDGSKVILAQNATLKYPEIFNENKRNVKLNGTAYFEITKNPEMPFHINTSNTEIEVLGTKFLVDATQAELEKVSVDEGKIALSSGSVFSRQKVILTKNEIGTWNAGNRQISKQNNPKQNSNAWLSGRLSFSNLPLSEVLITLENHFNIKITLVDESFAVIKYSGQFNTENAENIVKTICLTLNLSYQKERQNFVIKP